MYLTSESCAACGGGIIAFRKCSGNKTIVCMCDECNAVWLDPAKLDVGDALYPRSPEWTVGGLECSVSKSSGSDWATFEEIVSAGFASFIAGSA